jgi:glutaredoxin
MSLLSFDVRSRYDDRLVTVEGNGGKKSTKGLFGKKSRERSQDVDIFLFSISTCVWCRMGKDWLKDRGFRYTYLDIDQIPVDEKKAIREELKEIVGETASFPFLILDGAKWHSGFDGDVWERMIGNDEKESR